MELAIIYSSIAIVFALWGVSSSINNLNRTIKNKK